MKRSLLSVSAALVIVAASTSMATAVAPDQGRSADPARVDANAWSAAHRQDASRLAALDRLRAEVEGRPDVYAGISTNGPADLTIHVVKGREANADTGALRRAANLEDIDAKVVSVDRSTADLQKVMDAVPGNDVLAAKLSSYAIDVATNRVSVGVTESTAEVEAAARAEFGDAVALHVQERFELASGRFDDSSPFYGGIRFGNTTNACTYGFSVTNAYGTRYALTAGHCGSIGTTYAAMTAGNPPANAGSGYTHFGTTYFRRFGGGDVDAELVGDVDYGGRMWAHSNLTDNSGYSLPVHGSANSCQGCSIVFNGSFTGLRTGTLVGSGNSCFVYGGTVTSCGQQSVAPAPGNNLCQRGDSGGPVFAYDGQGGVTAVGIIAGVDSTGACTYTQVPTILNAWTSTVTPG